MARQRVPHRALADENTYSNLRQSISPGRELLIRRTSGRNRSLLQPRRNMTLKPLLLLTCCLLLVFIAALQSSFLFGNGYSSDGGLVGRWIDQRNLHQHEQAQQKWRPPNITFPDVQIKATRKTAKSHYSLFLGEILQRHQLNQSNVEWAVPPTTSLVSHSETAGHLGKFIDSIQLSGATATFTIAHAKTLEEDLRSESCHSNWFCQRCLNSPSGGGTYAACAALCRRCYIRILSTIPGRNDPPLRLEPSWSTGPPPKRRIPRIIHQAWHFYPRSWEFPERARMMSAWRSQPGYEHRFYHTVEQGCSFAYDSFSTVVGKACDMIGSRIRKQKFLELLLLYKYGGIFADGKKRALCLRLKYHDMITCLTARTVAGDVMLETNLDALIDADTSFFAAKSTGIVDSCLWTGLVGAEPGHPVIGRAIENILRALLLRTTEDSVAFERDFMGRSQSPDNTELWKLRAKNDLSEFVFKDCALGVAWNQVLETENPLATIEIGTHMVTGDDRKGNILLVRYVSIQTDGCDMNSLFFIILPHHMTHSFNGCSLQMSHQDAGATRITDVERNLLVASTDLSGVTGSTIQQRSKTSMRKQNIAKQELVE